MEAIIRQAYIDQIEKYLGKETIVVVVGQRRVGKSYMLRQLLELKSKDSANNIIYIDKEKRQFDAIQTYQDLNAYIEEHIDRAKHNYILIDEVQDIKEFERSIRSYRTEPNTDVIITGSNAHMLSSDLTTLIGGRYKEIRILPLSYEEFLVFHALPDNDESLGKYISFGGLPGLVVMGLDEEIARDYQMGIYNTVLLKDVVMRNQIRNVSFLEDLVRYLADNSGKLISANNICKFMKSQGLTITPTLIINYLSFLCASYIISEVKRFEVHGKKLFESNGKFYFQDHGLRNAIAGGEREGDIEKVLETVVYQHLMRMGFTVHVGQLKAGEIDFVCSRLNGERAYVQVAYVIADESTRQREFGNLKAIKDNYPKYVISMSPLVNRSDNDGIIHLHLRRFLTQGLQ
jgi:predicted AAA+ superfamily ATPase